MKIGNWSRLPNPKVVLVLPPRDGKYPSLESYPATPPTGLSIMAWETVRRLKDRGINCDPEIEIRFPENITQMFVDECAKADVLGLTDWFHTHGPAMNLVRRVKALNPKILTVVGGVNAKNLWRQILSNNPDVDLVCNGEGEDVLWRILAGESFSAIPNLGYRFDGEIVRTFGKAADLSDLDLWDFSFCDKAELGRWMNELSNNQMSHAPAGLSITRGCMKRDIDGPCVFCTCPGKYRKSPVEQAVRQVRHLQELGVSTFFETGDDFTDVGLLREIERSAGGELAKMWIYANPAAVSKECARLLRRIGVFDAFMGFETAVESMAQVANRPARLSDVEQAVLNLANEGIIPSTGVMIGLPGETLETAKLTGEALLGLVEKNPSIERVLVSVAVPFAGSAWYRGLCEDRQVVQEYLDHTGRVLSDDDDPDYLFLLRCSLNKSGTELGPILAYADELRSRILRKGVSVGSFGAVEMYPKPR